jgi:hypothetical protein
MMQVFAHASTVAQAPIMLGVGHTADDPTALQRAFDGFDFWSGLRLLSQSLGYVANLWSLFVVLRQDRSRRAPG